MILMQRMVTSSTQAIASALERRLEVLQASDVSTDEREQPDQNIQEQDGQERLDELMALRLAGLKNEKEEGVPGYACPFLFSSLSGFWVCLDGWGNGQTRKTRDRVVFFVFWLKSR